MPSTEPLPFAAVPFLDHHCHPWLRAWQGLDAAAFRACWTESPSADIAATHVPRSLPYRRALRALGALLGCAGDEAAILAARRAADPAAYLARLFAGANVEGLLVDDGYPPPAVAVSVAEVGAATGLPARPILRLETLVEALTGAAGDFDDLLTAFDAAVGGAAARGVVALKSIAAYRSGLALAPVAEDEAADAWRLLHASARRAGGLRLTAKPVIDFFVLRALGHAARQGLPVQFHTGYGDPDLDLRLANPLHLRPVLEDASLREATVVLLHGAYPYTREAAYLAAVYPRVYLDVSAALPPLGLTELAATLGQALGVAPLSKLLLSSDGARVPEHHALGARAARRALHAALGQAVAAGDLAPADIEDLAAWPLHRTARTLYFPAGGGPAPRGAEAPG